MRSYLLVALALLCVSVSVSATYVEPDAAVMEAPQIDDVTLLQMDSQAHTTNKNVASLEADLAAALASQQQLATELTSETHAAVGAQVELDAESMAEMKAEAQQHSAASTSAATETKTETEADAEAESESESEVDSEADSESETDADSDSESDSDSEADSENESESDSESDADSDADSESESDSEVDDDSFAKKAPRFSQKAKKTKKSKKSKKAARKAKKEAAASAAVPGEPKRKVRKFRQEVVSSERADPNGPADSVTLANGKKFFKSRVVSPNLVATYPKPKKVKRHSKERALTKKQALRFTEAPETGVAPKKPLSDVRKAFLRLNPSQSNSSPGFVKTFRAGRFPALKFDKPTVSQTVTQQLVIKTHAPSVRQRAEVSALRAASRTLRRINAKRREFKRALRALRKARNQVQAQIHRHHVLRAVQAKKVAARAARRAAWSALLQHRNLRKDLFRSLANKLRKGHLTGAARRAAIAALIKRNLNPAQRARLHAFIRGANTRRHRHRARRERQASRRRRRAQRRAARRARAVAAAQAAIKQVGTTKASGSVESSKATTRRVSATKNAATSAVSAKDANAVNALIARIRAAINHPDTRKARGLPSVGVTKQSAATQSTKATVRVGATKQSAATASSKTQTRVTPVRFAELESAEALATEAEQEALHELNTETEVDDEKSAPLLQVEAQVEAVTENTDEFLKEMGY